MMLTDGILEIIESRINYNFTTKTPLLKLWLIDQKNLSLNGLYGKGTGKQHMSAENEWESLNP